MIPDVSVFHPSKPPELPDSPPLVAIEILSPDDRFSVVEAKLEEYREWGVPHVWLVDPESQRFYALERTLQPVETLPIPELGIEVRPSDIFE